MTLDDKIKELEAQIERNKTIKNMSHVEKNTPYCILQELLWLNVNKNTK